MYIDKLDDIVNKYNNAYHSAIKMKLVDVKSSTYIDFDKKNKRKNPKFKVGEHLRTSNIKIFLQKVTFEINLKAFL